ncbi:MAG: CBS domain-containing protein [Bacteroidota bacterium]
MLVNEYLTNDFKPLSPKDTVEVARELFEGSSFDFLPIVDGSLLIGCLPSDFNLSNRSNSFVGDYLDECVFFFVQKNSNLIDTLRISGINDSNLIPVTNENNEYLGYVTQNDIMSHFSKSPFFSEIGGVLVVKKSIKEYGISELAQIVETENAKILGVFVSDFVGEEVVLTVKINQMRLGVIEAALKRFGYTILESYHENKIIDDMQDRYDSLMNYLDV